MQIGLAPPSAPLTTPRSRRVRTPVGRRVVVLALPGTTPLDLAIVQQVFGQAGELIVDPGGCGPSYVVTVAGQGPIASPIGWITPQAGIEAISGASTVVVPDHRLADRAIEPLVLQRLRSAATGGARLVSIAGGAFVLAAAGLLDGRRVAMHWSQAELLAKHHPLVEVDPTVLYTDDGDLLTSAGGAASVDLCLYMVRRDHGAQAAADVAHMLVAGPHRAGSQSQWIEEAVPAEADAGDDVATLQRWMVDHLDEPLNLRVLAHQVSWSERTLLRRFRNRTGASPLQWLLDKRITHAQRLLETTDLSIEQVATRSGFATGASLRHHFKRHVGTSPRAHRNALRRRPPSSRLTPADLPPFLGS